MHDDELPLNVGDVVILFAAGEDEGWYEAVKDNTGAKGMVPVTHLKRIQRLNFNHIGTA